MVLVEDTEIEFEVKAKDLYKNDRLTLDLGVHILDCKGQRSKFYIHTLRDNMVLDLLKTCPKLHSDSLVVTSYKQEKVVDL